MAYGRWRGVTRGSKLSRRARKKKKIEEENKNAIR